MSKDRENLEAQRAPGALPLVRFFRWSEPTVSYGRLQDRASAELFAHGLGVRAVVQRPTGGGLVCHRGDLSLSVVWRRDHSVFPDCLKNVYRAFHEMAVEYLRSKGLDARLYENPERRPPGNCFTEPVESDVLWKDVKVLGGALQVTRWGRLYQGDLRTGELGLAPEVAAGELARVFGSLFRHPPEN